LLENKDKTELVIIFFKRLYNLLISERFAALLQIFGLWVGLRGFANVLHCGLGFFLFEREGEKNKINSLNFRTNLSKRYK
jgi:hypothetical protein